MKLTKNQKYHKGDKKVIKRCPKCGDLMDLGRTGVVVGAASVCDRCAGIERDSVGGAFYPGQTRIPAQTENGEVTAWWIRKD